jgi:hypothetical protein
MKNVQLLVLTLALVGCGGSSDPFNMAKELLTKQDYYSSCIIYSTTNSINEYAKYRFEDSSYSKIEYKDSSYSEVKKSIKDKVEYLTALNVTIYNGDLIKDCTVADNGNNSVTLICLSRSSDTNYSIITNLYPTEQEALEDSNCSN